MTTCKKNALRLSAFIRGVDTFFTKMVALVNIVYGPWCALGFPRPARATTAEVPAQATSSAPNVFQPSASFDTGQPVPGGDVTATAPEPDAFAPATGPDDRDVQDAAVRPDSPEHEGQEATPAGPQRGCFGGHAAVVILKMCTRWNKRHHQQIRSLQAKQLTAVVPFTAGEDDDEPDESGMCKAVVWQVPAEPKPDPHSAVVPGAHVWAFFDSAVTTAHLSHARMVSGKNIQTGT